MFSKKCQKLCVKNRIEEFESEELKSDVRSNVSDCSKTVKIDTCHLPASLVFNTTTLCYGISEIVLYSKTVSCPFKTLKM